MSDTAGFGAGIYLHIPFCRRLCPYCDFYSLVRGDDEIESYIHTLLKEMDSPPGDRFHAFMYDTIFFGGGTPSVLAPGQISQILEKLRREFSVSLDSEITVECNPSSIDEEKAESYLQAGVNRLSLGIQSFNDRHLKTLGRLHDSKTAIKAFNEVRRAGFANINVDLIYGLPDQTADEWTADLRKAVELGPEHISAYNLIIEPNTPFGTLYRHGKLNLPSEDIQSGLYDLLIDLLSSAGFERYELSNFAKNGCQCRHNLKYWQNRPYLGLGPSAVSYDGERRYKNNPDLDHYWKSPSDTPAPIREIETIDRNTALEERIIMGLRLSDGLSFDAIKNEFDYDLINDKKDVIVSLADAGYITLENDRLKLASKGLFLSDEITVKLL